MFSKIDFSAERFLVAPFTDDKEKQFTLVSETVSIPSNTVSLNPPSINIIALSGSFLLFLRVLLLSLLRPFHLY